LPIVEPMERATFSNVASELALVRRLFAMDSPFVYKDHFTWVQPDSVLAFGSSAF
jgi:hypothetical protein